MKAAGAIGFSNDGLPLLDKDVFYEALKSGELILSHCENETEEIRWQIEVFKKVVLDGYSPRLHFCHVSKKESVDLIREAKKQGGLFGRFKKNTVKKAKRASDDEEDLW